MKTKKQKKLRKKSALRTLLVVALSDGSLNEMEKTFLHKKSLEYKISQQVFTRILENPNKGKLVFPEDFAEKLNFMYDLVEVMITDGIITIEELEICRKISKKMGLIPESINLILKDLGRNYKTAA